MPANFAPPYPAYQAKYAADTQPLVSCFLGVQDHGGDALKQPVQNDMA